MKAVGLPNGAIDNDWWDGDSASRYIESTPSKCMWTMTICCSCPRYVHFLTVEGKPCMNMADPMDKGCCGCKGFLEDKCGYCQPCLDEIKENGI